MFGQIQRIVIAGLTSLVLIACSLPESGRQASGTASLASASLASGWSYQKSWKLKSSSQQLVDEFPGSEITIKGQCHFSDTLIASGLDKKRTLLMPFLNVNSDGTLAPEFRGSLPFYETLDPFLSLAPASESIQLYQRWVSSLEHACPEGLSRNISQCSLKNLYSIGGLWGGKELYNFERLNHWLTQNNQNAFLLIPDFMLLNSRAALGLKYSVNASAVVQRPTYERITEVTPHLGKQSVDWVKLNGKHQLSSELISSGRCSVVWQEFEQVRKQKPSGKETIDQLNQINQALIPVLQEFIKDALTQVSNLKR